MAREKHIAQTSPETKAEIIENSVQNVATRPVLTAAELKKQFVKPVVNEDGLPCAISELDRVVNESEAALDEVYKYYEDKTEETNGYAKDAETAQGKAEEAKTGAETAKNEAIKSQRIAEQAKERAISANIDAVNSARIAQKYAVWDDSFSETVVENGVVVNYSGRSAKYYSEQAFGFQGSAEMSAASAGQSATKAEQFAVGEGKFTVDGKEYYSSKHYSDLSGTYSNNAWDSAEAAELSAERAEAAADRTAGIYRYKGTVETYDELLNKKAEAIAAWESEGIEAAKRILTNGDVYNVAESYGDFGAGTNFAFYMINEEDYSQETGWDALGGSFYIEQSTIAKTGKLSDAIQDAAHRTVTDAEKTRWNEKQDALTFDNTPTEGSSNPVTSGGVKAALNEKADKGEIPSNVVTQEALQHELEMFKNGVANSLSETNARIDTKSDKATVEALQRDVADLYAIAEQGGVYTVTEVEDKYTARETAGGLNIVDGVPTTVTRIRGNTVKSVNLFYQNGQLKQGETAVDITYDETTQEFTLNGTVTNSGNIRISQQLPINVTNNTDYYTVTRIKMGGSITFTENSELLYGLFKQDSSTEFATNRLSEKSTNTNQSIISAYTKLPISDRFIMYVQCLKYNGNIVFNNFKFKLQIEKGQNFTSYTPYFKGLKNSSFKGIVSTGKNIFDQSLVNIPTAPVNGLTVAYDSNENCFVFNGTTTATTQLSFTHLNLIGNIGKKYIILNEYISGNTNVAEGQYAVSYFGRGDNLSDINNWIACGLQNKNAYNAYATSLPQKYINSFWFFIQSGITFTNYKFRVMLRQTEETNFPFEPYTADTLSLPEPVALPEYDYIDAQTGKKVEQSKTIVLDGTEVIGHYNNHEAIHSVYFRNILPIVENFAKGISSFNPVASHEDYTPSTMWLGANNLNIYWMSILDYLGFTSTWVDKANPTTEEVKAAIASLKQWLADKYAAGDPVTIVYKSSATSTETDISIPDKYTAYKHGSETIDQGGGENDNSEYGTEITVEQKYYTLTGTTTEGGTNEN